MSRSASLSILFALSLGCAACGGSPATKAAAPTTAAPPTPPPETTATAPAPSAAGTLATLPDSPAGHQLRWVLGAMQAGVSALDDASLQAHFAPPFLAKVPPARLRQVLMQLAKGGPFHVRSTNANNANQLIASIQSSDSKTRLRVSIATGPGDDHPIMGLLFGPDFDRPTTWAEVDKRLGALHGRAQYLAAELDGTTCKPLHQLDAGRELAIGSTFKLYVLLGLVDRIAAGKAHWNDELAVRDDWKSLPSGITQNDPAGTKRSLQYLAGKMISISDNTAADHLLYTVGRKRVEAALTEAGHSHPALDVPFLSTRELFLLKLTTPPDELRQYLAGDAQARRRYLDGTLAKKPAPPMALAGIWHHPIHISDIEWFASSTDLCNIMATLHARSEKPALAPLREVLSINSGIPDPKKNWSYIGYKGGSEPGVLNLTWLLERADGRWFVLTVTVNDPDQEVAQGDVLAIAGGARELLAKEAL